MLRDLTEPLRAQVATVAVAGTQVTLGLVDERSVRWGDPERSADKVAVLGPLLGQPGIGLRRLQSGPAHRASVTRDPQ